MTQLFSLDAVYALCGLLLLLFAAGTLRDRRHPRRYGSALFWALLGLIFLGGGWWPHWLTGLLVLVLVVIDGTGRMARGSQPARSSSARVPCGPRRHLQESRSPRRRKKRWK